MINYSKNEYVNVSVGFGVCSRYCDLKGTWGGVIYWRIVGINLTKTLHNFYKAYSGDIHLDVLSDTTLLKYKIL
jgi:hypothetical protein